MTGTRHPMRRRLVALVAIVGLALGAAAGLAAPASAEKDIPNRIDDPTVYWWRVIPTPIPARS